jgi:predicted RNase H-like HicB family nuclease
LRFSPLYDVSCPTLQGCHSQGETEEEAIKNIRDAIREYALEVRAQGASFISMRLDV